MITILFRTLVIYLVLVTIMRLMGKRQIGELELTDLVTTLLISEIASLPITDNNLPVSYALIPMVTLLILEVGSSVVLVRFPKLKAFVSPRPTVIIRKGTLDQKALLSLRISMEELMSEVRQQGYPDLSQISDAIVEKNGKLTLLPKPEYAQPTVGQLGATPENDELMHVVMCNGTYSTAGLKLIGKDRKWLEKEILRRGYTPDRLFCVTANDTGKLYLIPLQQTGQCSNSKDKDTERKNAK